MAQKFSKNDSDENKFFAVWEAMLDQTFVDLNAYFSKVDQSPALGNALWEANAVDVWGIIEKGLFVKIFDQLISAGYNAGAIDTYCRIIYALFGNNTVIDFVIDSPMEMTINITADYSNFSQWVTRAGGKMLTRGGFKLVFRTLLQDVPNSQILSILESISNAGTKINFNLN
tara:strand:+ start:247 stop:762 length:516 start_codon:yes stop_codon:yes gene_type:complete